MKLAVNSGGRHGGSAICRLWAKLPSSRLPSNVCHRVLMTARNPATLLSVKLNKANVIHDYLKVKGKGKPYLYSAFVMRCLTLWNSGMARVNEGSYSFTCRLSTSAMNHTCLYSPATERYSYPIPLRIGGWVGLSYFTAFMGEAFWWRFVVSTLTKLPYDNLISTQTRTHQEMR